jgi:DNA-binding MarR family transcriptional regulator
LCQASPLVPSPLPFDPINEAGRQWDQHWGADATPSMQAVTSLMRVQQIVLARLNELLRPFDVTFPRYEALMLLYFSRNGSLPLGKMGDRLQVHPTSVTNIVDGLEKSGLVQRVPHETDRRTKLAAITERGREVARETTTILNDAQFGTAPLQHADLAEITRVLRVIRADADDFA